MIGGIYCCLLQGQNCCQIWNKYFHFLHTLLHCSAIKSRGFTVEERGKTDLRGYGPLNTYFLLANEHATDDDLCGRPRIGTQEISFINEGKEEKPSFDKKHKKAVQTPSSGGKSSTAPFFKIFPFVTLLAQYQ